MSYSLKQLKVFITVAQEKSSSRARERIGLSQSAMSHSMRRLESHTDVRLLNRAAREIVPTDTGQQSALRLERLLGELSGALRDIGRIGRQLSGKVRVAANQTIPVYLIPQCIAESHRRYPDIQFVLHNRPQQWVMGSIRQGDVDFGIVIDSSPMGDLQCEVILSEPFFLLCHRDNALAVEDYVPWRVLQGARLVLQDYTSGSRPLVDIALARNGIQANVVQEIGHPVALFPMVTASIGIGILPALALPLPEDSPLVVKRIAPVVGHQLILVHKENRSLSTTAEALWDVVRGQGSALMAGREGDPLYQI